MAKLKPVGNAKKTSAAPPAQAPGATKDGVREIFESIVIAFVLAFLFRAFEAEAFVIPTGSMAPTLMGVHKDLVCEECGFPYRVGASDEEEGPAEDHRAEMVNPRRTADERKQAADALANLDVVSAVCPNCRFKMDTDPKSAAGRMFPSYRGDRILVAKFPYDFADPQRWDVVVFKYPQTANENYIKRCVGLPNETISIYGGNLFTRRVDASETTIARKPPDKVRAMMQAVYDNDYALVDLRGAGLPLRWEPIEPTKGAAAWQLLDGAKSYRIEAGGEESWLGYQHRVPGSDDWKRYETAHSFTTAGGEIRPRLIDDFYAYNAGSHRAMNPMTDNAPGCHWVGDLVFDCQLNIEGGTKATNPQAVLRLIKGGRTFDCVIDIDTGKAHFEVNGADLGATAATSIRAGSRHTVSFGNVDCELFLWVDGRAITFDNPTTYDSLDPEIPTVEDLTPVRIGSRGAGLEASHLKIYRDLYYVACRDGIPLTMVDYENPRFNASRASEVANFLASPAEWPRAFSHMRSVKFALGPDEFLMLGDNSPRSKDSRLWTGRDEDGRQEHYVRRDLLVGKAVFVYWPHSWNRIPGTRIPFPFFPNFARMKFVR